MTDREWRDLCWRMAGWIESEGELHPIAQALLAERDKLEGEANCEPPK